MSNLTSKLLGGVAVAIIASAASAPASAQTVLYSGGGTLAEKVYRDIFNCYGGSDGGAFETRLVGGPAGCNGNPGYNANVLESYVGVGSGNGKKALTHHDSSAFTDGPRTPDLTPVPASPTTGAIYGTGTGASWSPNTNDTGPFPAGNAVHFAGSDDPLTAGDLTTYFATSGGTDIGHTGNFGAPIQVPALTTAIAVPFHPTVGWVEKGAKASGGSSQVSIDTNTLCGIFNGDIQLWSDNAFKVNNGNQQLGNGQIKVYYRSDSSGSTFLFSNALIHQCGTQSTPRANITHNIPDQWMTDNGLNPVASDADHLPSSVNGFFVTAAAHLPANFTGASGSGGIQAAINGNAGAVSYLSPDFVLPIDTSGPKGANLQSFDTNPASPRFIVGTKAKFVAPSGKNASGILGKLKPPSKVKASCTVDNSGNPGTSPDGICAHNPINWGVSNGAPTGTAVYPVGGFTFIDTYTCYASASDAAGLAGTTAGSLGLLRWYFGTTTDNASVVKTQLAANGFGLVPGAWISAIKALISTDAVAKINTAGTGNCAGKSGA